MLAMSVLAILWAGFRCCGPLLAEKEETWHSSHNRKQSGVFDEQSQEYAEWYAGPLEQGFVPEEMPPYAGSPYYEVNDNIPYFHTDDYPGEALELYGDLDSLGRCGVTFARVCEELMPTRERGLIGAVKPTGWQYTKYDFIDGKYLYNRCHLIGFQLTGENANECNLITGTRYLNVEGMLPFENLVAEYVRSTGGVVLYRVTPIFEGDNLLATGVLLEAWSPEDEGLGVCFNVFCYNVQPGIEIDYATGESRLAQE